MSFGGFIGNLISGGGSSGYNDMGNEIQQGVNSLNTDYSAGRNYLNPFFQNGMQAYGGYSNALNNMSNPSQFYNQTMGQYNMSPAAQFQEQQGQQAMNQGAAAGGTIGSGAEQKALAGYSQGVASQDQNQYFNNVMGVNNQYLNGEQGIYGMGLNAGNALNQNYMGLGNQVAAQYDNLGESQLGGQSSMYGGIGGLMGQLGGSSWGQGWLGKAGSEFNSIF